MRDDKHRIIPAGSLMVLSFGSYSDYRVNSIAVALKMFTAGEALAEFRRTSPVNEDEYEDSAKFTAWLVVHGWLAELQHGEWCMGGYSLMDDDSMVQPAFEVKP